METGNFTYYVVALLMIVIGFVVFKKVAGCMIRTVVTFVLVAILATLYYLYFRQ